MNRMRIWDKRSRIELLLAFCYICCDKVYKNLNKGVKNRKSLHFMIKKLQNGMIITKNVLSLSS